MENPLNDAYYQDSTYYYDGSYYDDSPVEYFDYVLSQDLNAGYQAPQPEFDFHHDDHDDHGHSHGPGGHHH